MDDMKAVNNYLDVSSEENEDCKGNVEEEDKQDRGN